MITNTYKTPPFELAAAAHEDGTSERSFEEDLLLHHLYGYVISTPTVFVMGRPIEKDAPDYLIKLPSHQFYYPNCWLIYLAAGCLAEFFDHTPYYLPWVGWERRSILRFYQTEKVRKAIYGQRRQHQTSESAAAACAD